MTNSHSDKHCQIVMIPQISAHPWAHRTNMPWSKAKEFQGASPGMCICPNMSILSGEYLHDPALICHSGSSIHSHQEHDHTIELQTFVGEL